MISATSHPRMRVMDWLLIGSHCMHTVFGGSHGAPSVLTEPDHYGDMAPREVLAARPPGSRARSDPRPPASPSPVGPDILWSMGEPVGRPEFLGLSMELRVGPWTGVLSAW
jgi:hypothetical protein